jgi:hypothetical protein
VTRPNSNPQHPSNSGKSPVPTFNGAPTTYNPPPNPSAPSGSKPGTKPTGPAPGSKLPQGAKAQARQAIRQATRQALRTNKTPTASKAAVKVLGAKKAQAVIKRTTARRTTKSGAYKKGK